MSINSFAQSGKPILKDDLLKDKDMFLARFIPMADGQYLHKLYQLPIDDVINRINDFKAALSPQIEQEQALAVRVLKTKDADYYSKNVLSWYMGLYGMDSIGMENLNKIMIEIKGTTDYPKLVDSAIRKAFVKRLNIEERALLTDMVNKDSELNDEALFRRSAAYRKWINDYLMRLRNTKYRADSTLGYEGNDIVKIKIINNEITNTFIKEYLNYETVCTVLKMVKNAAAKEEVYKNFMATTTNPAYKEEVGKIYGNYKRMTSNALSPDFNYTDVNGKPVSLTDLRGKYVYIDVWATWCTPCKAEIPFLTKLEEDYHGKNIYFVSLSVDKEKDKLEWISYVKEHNLQGIQLIADKDFSSEFIKKFNINSIPRFILIDPQGRIISGDAKRPSNPELRKELDALLR
ncbi:MAG: TlpA disulfide reductase family protein [Bacteroidales bacterium]|nr:TlpA family protein disulfide reductase [Bacteroidales bacterium]MDD2424412.1 TlpA disulfide reductase family protein [Bacteroidales bacterium]MDD3988994.1 TlpA disulfide reductase family protein [Bacteroidales bacterium]